MYAMAQARMTATMPREVPTAMVATFAFDAEGVEVGVDTITQPCEAAWLGHRPSS